MSPIKEAFIKLIQSLPDDCTEEDIYYHLYVREKVQHGINAIDEGKVVPHVEARRRMAEWLKSPGPSQP
jgi:hypothetical protein